MRELLVAGAALMALAVASANAADSSLPIAVKAALVPTVYDWSGFYAGGRVGYAWGTSNWTSSSPTAANISGSLDLFQPFDAFKDTGSFSQGLQAGYNYMLPNRILIGAEADVTFPGFPSSAGISIGGISNLTSPTLGAETFSETVLTSGTVRGRIGYAPGSWLFYGTGGFAWTYNQLSLTQLASGATESPFLWRLGFAAGVGVEAPIAPHWTARLEYLFTDYGNSSTTFFAGAQRVDSNFALQELRAGLNYQFGNVAQPTPMLAKASTAPDPDIVNFHGQTTFLEQAYPAIRSPYQGAQQLARRRARPRNLGRFAVCWHAVMAGGGTMDQPRNRPGIRARQYARRCRISERRSLQSRADLSLCAVAARIHSPDHRPGRRK